MAKVMRKEVSRVLFDEWLSLRFRIKCKPLGLAAQTRLNHSCGQSSRLAAQPGRLPAPLCRRLREQRLCVGSVAFSHAWVPLPALPPECFCSFLCLAKPYKSPKAQFRY